MKKAAVMGILLFSLCNVLVYAEDSGNKTVAVPTINISANVDQTLYLNTKYTSLFKLEIKDKKPCSPKDTVTVFYNISNNGSLVKEESFSKEIGCTTSASTGEFTPEEQGDYTLCGIIANSSVSFSSDASCLEFEVLDTSNFTCDINMQLKTNETIFYENGQSIKFQPELNNKSFPFVIEYWIEDLFGDMVKPKLNTTNTNEKSWKTNIQEQDRVLFLKAVVYPSCNDADISNNMAEKMFVVKKNEVESSPSSSSTEETAAAESTISISKISSESITFGEILNAELEIYKGTTDKYSVSAWVEKDEKIVSKKTKVHLKNKNTLYKLTVPILIDSNCDEKIKDGDAQLVVEGLGVQGEKEFTVEGINKKLCQEKDDLKTEKGKAEKTMKSEETKKQTEKTKTADQTLSLLSQAEEIQPLLKTEKTQRKEVPGYDGIIVYESVSERSKNLVSWVLFVAFALLSLVLACKRGNT